MADFATVRGGEGFLMVQIFPNMWPIIAIIASDEAAQATDAQARVELSMAAVQRDGMTIVPLKLYFNEHGKAAAARLGALLRKR